MDPTNKDVYEAFLYFGIQIKNDKNMDSMISKGIQLCSQYDLSAEELAANWLGYAAKKSIDEMTLDSMDDFERDQLGKSKSNMKSKPAYPSKVHLPLYTVETAHLIKTEEDILLQYGASPAAVSKLKSTTARSGSSRSSASAFIAPQSPMQRSSACNSHLSPHVGTPSERYSTRTNSGALMSHYVSPGLPEEDFKQKKWEVETQCTPRVELTSFDGSSSHIMFEKVRAMAGLVEENILYMAEQLSPAVGGNWSCVDTPSNERINIVGRINYDRSGRLSPSSVILQASQKHAGGMKIRLDLSAVPNYAFFPGQIVGLSGVNTTGFELVVDEVYGGRVPDFDDHPVTVTSPVQVVVACGPFTTSDNLLFEPLQDLLDTVVKSPPHVLVLLGPILDFQHPLLLEPTATETLQAVVDRALATVMAALANCATEVYVVSASRDSTSSGVYPTAAIRCGLPKSSSGRRPHMLSDPSLLVVEGVVMALTTQDVLLDMSKEEMASAGMASVCGDRMQRLVHHILAQQRLYPLSPPPGHVCVSPALMQKHASLNCLPHILLLPSDIKNFIKEVCRCVTINPERLCKGKSGGYYSRIELHPPTPDSPQQPVVKAAVYRV